MPTPIHTTEATNTTEIGIAVPNDYDRLLLICSYVTADIQPGAVLNAYLTDVPGGISYDTGPSYINVGFSNWQGEPNAATWPQPRMFGEPQLLSLGCRIGIDVGERLDLGIHARVEFTAMGSVNGNSVSPVYRCDGYAGFIGGNAGISPRPSHSGGGYWFSADPYGTPFDWPAKFEYVGHWKKPGARIRAMLLTMNGGNTLGRRIKTGRFELWGLP